MDLWYLTHKSMNKKRTRKEKKIKWIAKKLGKKNSKQNRKRKKSTKKKEKTIFQLFAVKARKNDYVTIAIRYVIIIIMYLLT